MPSLHDPHHHDHGGIRRVASALAGSTGIFNSFLIIFGVTSILIAIGAMTQSIIELEFGDAFGKRRNKRMIDKLKDHYIICGYGRVGRGAAEANSSTPV